MSFGLLRNRAPRPGGQFMNGDVWIAGDLNVFVAACEQEPAEQGRNRDQGGFPEAHRPMRHESVLRTDTIITVTLSNTADGKELRIKPSFTRWLSPAVESNLWAGKRSAKTWDAGWRTRKRSEERRVGKECRSRLSACD